MSINHHYLNDINDSVGEVSDEGAGNLGVDEAVAHDQNVEQRLAQAPSVLHLPACAVVLHMKKNR